MTATPDVIQQAVSVSHNHADTLLRRWLPEGKREGSEWVSTNPTRSDNHPGSFKINLDTGKWSDFATGDRGGDLVSLYAYLFDAKSQPDAARAVLDELGYSVDEAANHRKIVATYSYRDETGIEVRQKIRYIPKDFRFRHQDETGQWIYKAGPGPAVLYNLPAVKAAIAASKIIYIVEGEKDADRLNKAGLCATTNIEGAAQPGQKTKWRKEYTTQLAGAAHVVLLSDNDNPGHAHMAAIAKALQGHVGEVRLLELPGLPAKGDVSDWLNQGHSVDELVELANNAPSHVDKEKIVDDKQQVKPLRGITGAELLLKKFAPIAFLMPDLLPTIGVFLLAGKQKLGKSWFALALALAHVCGGNFLNRDIPKGKVLYLGLEDSERRMQSRILVLQPDAENNPCIFDKIRFFHATDNIPRLDQGLIQFMEPYLSDVTLVVVDVLQKVRPLKSSGNIYQDDYAVITALQTLALSHNLCVLLLTHTRKQDADDAFDTIMSSGGLSGAADGSLVLTRKRGNGAAILHVTGREVPECEYGLTFKDGSWEFLGSAEIVKATNEQNKIVELLIDAGSEGMTTADIADSLGKNEPVIRKLLRKLVLAERVRKRDTKPAPHFAVCDGPDAPPLPRAVTTHTHIDR